MFLVKDIKGMSFLFTLLLIQNSIARFLFCLFVAVVVVVTTLAHPQTTLNDSKKELESSRADYDKLKDRAKSVASELKERRAECRTLSSEIGLLKSNNLNLQDRITELEATGMDMNESSQETKEQLTSLREALKDKERQLNDVNASHDVEKKRCEEALSSYKRKAQQSLALANARSASAVQSREEAEMEARAARTTADSAMQRAVTAEMDGKRAMAEAKAFVDEMETEVAKYNTVKNCLDQTTEELKKLEQESTTYQETNEKLKCELISVSGQLEAEQITNNDLKLSVSSEQDRSRELYDEVERLRKAGKSYQNEIRRLTEVNQTESSTAAAAAASVVPERNKEAEATIAMLQQEVYDSNRAIQELKETLTATMEEKQLSASVAHNNPNGGRGGSGAPRMNGHNNTSDADTPLFYAMEKQAELTQARDEIARLANLVGDAESSKQEATDDMLAMKQLMEDAESRLQRHEQLQKRPDEQESVNLEYLKNIMLSYLNATSIQEKKALLPVIGTVLCLTQQEQITAAAQLDKGHGSVIDSVTTNVFNMKWS